MYHSRITELDEIAEDVWNNKIFANIVIFSSFKP